MRKYIIAAVVTVALAAGAASASMLALDAGTQQAGTTQTVDCTATAVLSYSNYVDGQGEFAINQVKVSTDPACDGNFVNLAHSTRAGGGSSLQAGAYGVALDANGDACVTADVKVKDWGNPTATDPAHTEANISLLVKNTADASPAFTSGWFTGTC